MSQEFQNMGISSLTKSDLPILLMHQGHGKITLVRSVGYRLSKNPGTAKKR